MRADPAVPILLLALALSAPALADCPELRGDLAPGELITAFDPPRWQITGDDLLGVGDVIALMRAVVGLQDLAWTSPSATCPPLPGDFAPGVLDETEDPPVWHPDPDGALTVGDTIALMRAVVDLQELGPGLAECVHELSIDWVGNAPRQATDRRCLVGLSHDVAMVVTAFDELSEEGFRIDRYTVTYSNLTRGGASDPGVDVPQPIDAVLFLDPGVPTYMQVERLSILDEAAKFLPPLNADVFYASGAHTFQATLTVYGSSTDRPDAVCSASRTHTFQVFDSGPDTVPEEDEDCLVESGIEGL